MKYRNINNIKIEDARIMFRNFSGAPSQYNRNGNRNFCVRIENPEVAQTLTDDGWNIRTLAPRDPDGDYVHYLPVTVSFDNYPANVILHANGNATKLDEETIGSLDYAEIKNVDLIIRPYQWEVTTKDGTNTGVKAYLKTMHVTIEEDPFAAKYAAEEYPREEAPF